MTDQAPILRVAVPAPLRRVFDYLPPVGAEHAAFVPGQRMRVPFGRQSRVGLLLELAHETSLGEGRLKPVEAILDEEAILPADIVGLLRWASDYYHHPIGEVMLAALPGRLRQGAAASVQGEPRWQLTAAGQTIDDVSLARAPVQARLLAVLRAHADGVTAALLDEQIPRWRDAMVRLRAKGLVSMLEQPCLESPGEQLPATPRELTDEQHAAIASVVAAIGTYQAFLLDGVTGSGKTEVYLGIIEQVIKAGGQALVLVPEISLTPQTVARFRARFQVPVAVLHSGLGERERLCAWCMARDGQAGIVIGTRSAVFTPLRNPAVIIVDEEHDASLKQQEGFRYHARDVAVMRARRCGIPVVLGSATPSIESLYNVTQQRYRALHLSQRVGGAVTPHIHVLDVRHQPMDEGLSATLLEIIRRHLDSRGQVLLFLNRRGYAPVMLCHDCGWLASCPRCDAHMTVHQARQRLICHHCGHERALQERCPECGSGELRNVGQGTQRVEQALRRHFPATAVARIDRDTTRRKGELETLLTGVRAGATRILIGTQMLAKGHHFPEVTMVGMLDIDQGLFSTDFRASERMGQLIVQVAGRAGRAERPGEVYVQTHHPHNPLLQTLIKDGYAAFASAALEERAEAALPPCTCLALLRAEAPLREAPHAFLEAARRQAEALGVSGVQFIGPVPSPMERRAGRYRAQLLLQAAERRDLHRLLQAWLVQLEASASARQVRWSLDVDPIDTY